MKITYSIGKEALQNLLKAFDDVGLQKSMVNTSQVVRETANVTQKLWQSWSMGTELEGIPKINAPKPEIAQSIKVSQNNPLMARVYTDNPEMDKIAKGIPSIDMKDLNSPWMKSRKTRVGKDETPYLIIPFSWRTRGSNLTNVVPMQIVKALKSRNLSFVVNSPDPTKIEKNRHGEPIARNSYSWGGRIGEAEARVPNKNGGIPYDAGMVRMWDSSNKNSVRGKYFTFRVLSPKADKGKWIRKEIPGINIADKIEKMLEPDFRKLVEEAIKKDLSISMS